MAQAKTLTTAEINQVLAYIENRKYKERNRAMFFMSLWAACRVGEIAAIKMGDVVNTDGTIKAEVRLSASQTKGGQPRTVFLPKKLQDELAKYLVTRFVRNPELPFFHTAGRLVLDLLPTFVGVFLWTLRCSASNATSFLTLIHCLGICIRALLLSMLTVLAMHIASSVSSIIHPIL